LTYGLIFLEVSAVDIIPPAACYFIGPAAVVDVVDFGVYLDQLFLML
jgi:hypothetical protein